MNKKNRIKDGNLFNTVAHIILIIQCAFILLPLILCISISVSDQASIYKYGYTFIPKKLNFEAYAYVFKNGLTLFHSFGVTVIVTALGTVFSLLVTAMYAYVVSRRDFKGRKFFNYFMFFPMLFSGGLVATYLWQTQIGMYNNLACLIVPMAFNSWNCIILRTFLQTSVPFEIIESGKIDGAGEYRIFFKLIVPIAVPGLATIALFAALSYWNDWYTPLVYIRNENLYGLQFYLQRIMTNVQVALSGKVQTTINVPSESVRMVLCVIAIGPIVLAYPFCQKFLIKGITIGSVKG